MVKKLDLLFQTVRHLKPSQIGHQIKYRLIKPRPLRAYRKEVSDNDIQSLAFIHTPPVPESWQGKGKFNFLNLGVDFENRINWDFQEYGKLWNYNLQYANYLLQPTGSDNEKAQLIADLYSWLLDGRLPLEPYPVSLRSINIIRWLCEKKITQRELIGNLYAELDFLSRRLEYHLLGNHLLENAFALLMGGAFFGQADWVKKGRRILQKELEEQILPDGAHFELSPMYHQIIFFRVLELIDWYSKWGAGEQDFVNFLTKKAGALRTWLENISFLNGDIPHFNDSAKGIAYSTPWLLKYADRLSIVKTSAPLRESGYRSVRLGNYECKVDFAQLGPSYQPGHAHADTLGFILYVNKIPLFVEQGTSTYQVGDVRARERSTAAHNTVVVANKNQSNVWGGFRVAERAETRILLDEPQRLKAEHDGYRTYGVMHQRTFEFSKGKVIVIDDLKGNDDALKEFHLHIYPGIDLEIASDQRIELSNGVSIIFDTSISISFQLYEMAEGYNKYKTGKKIVVSFTNKLITTILTGN